MSSFRSGQCLISAHADCPHTITVAVGEGIAVACECDCHQLLHLLEKEAV